MKSNIDIVKDYVAGVRPFVQVGYTGKKYVKRAVGERWVDAKGQEWEQKESGPVTVNRVASIVKAAMDQKCRCGQDIKWGSKLDRIFFSKTGLCENCLIDYETKLRIVGIYPDYERYKVVSNEIGHLNEIRDKLKEFVDYFTNDTGDVTMICNEEGFTERWKNTNKDKILKDAKEDLKKVKRVIAELKKIKKEAKEKYHNGAKKFKLKTYGR